MAVLVLTNAFVEINSVDLSDHVKEVSLEVSADMLESTSMGDTTHEQTPGLKDHKLEVDFYQDFASAKVDATMFPLIGAAAFAVEVRAVNAARSSTNPGYTGNFVLETYPVLGNSVGEMAMAKVSLRPAGALSRTTSST